MWVSSRGRRTPPDWRNPQQGGWRSQSQHDPPGGPGTHSPLDLVRYLGQYQTFSASFSRLLEDKDLQPLQLRQMASTYPHVFHINDEVLKLRPQLDICSAHHGSQGCRNFSSCEELHICREYVLRRCPDDHNCGLGHRWRTGHNMQILKAFFLEGLELPILRKLVQSLLKPDDTGELQVCHAYNKGACNLTDCHALHVCLSFVVGLTKCSRKDCELNHELLDPQCCRLLRAHDLSTNEAPRDVLLALLVTYPAIAQDKQALGRQTEASSCHSGQQKGKDLKINVESDRAEERQEDDAKMLSVTPRIQRSNKEKHVRFSSSRDPSSKDDSGGSDGGTQESDSEDNSSSESDMASISHKATVNKGKTVVSSTKESRRKHEKTGSRRPCSQRYSWQVSDGGTTWMNLYRSQVTRLERAFCDPSQDGVDLPPLHSDTLGTQFKDLFALLGSYPWRADFKAMSLTNLSIAKTLQILRWCGGTVTGQSVRSPKFLWYFRDPNGKWIKYDDVDTLGKDDLVSNITSDDIEKHFLGNPSIPMSFQNSKYSYRIDFNTMTESNLDSGVCQKVTRRPKPHFDLNNEQKDLETTEGQRLLSIRRLPSVDSDASDPVSGNGW